MLTGVALIPQTSHSFGVGGLICLEISGQRICG